MNKELYTEWLRDPRTLEIFRLLQNLIDNETAKIISGDTLRMDSADETALTTARTVGYIDGLKSVLTLEFTDDSD